MIVVWKSKKRSIVFMIYRSLKSTTIYPFIKRVDKTPWLVYLKKGQRCHILFHHYPEREIITDPPHTHTHYLRVIIYSFWNIKTTTLHLLLLSADWTNLYKIIFNKVERIRRSVIDCVNSVSTPNIPDLGRKERCLSYPLWIFSSKGLPHIQQKSNLPYAPSSNIVWC